MPIHTATLLLANILLSLTLALCLGLVARRTRHDGLPHWAGALAAHGLAYLLFALRGLIDDWASIVLANVLLSAAIALYHEGLHQFQQTPPRRWLIWAPVAAMLLLFPLAMGHFQTRVVLNALILCIQFTLFTRQLAARWRPTPGHGKLFVLAGFLLGALVLLARAAVALQGRLDAAAIGDSSPTQALTFLAALLMTTLTSFGLVLMSKERADALNQTLALQDELTGLNNRRHIQQALAQHLAQARRNAQPLAVLVLDIDHFKRVNDTHGHLCGDRVLRELAACLRSRLRTQDVAGRWGGEEFIVVLPNTDERGARTVAEQLRSSVQARHFTTPTGQPLALTVSIGLHVLPAGQLEEQEQFIGAADRALYQAKQGGRNRVVHG